MQSATKKQEKKGRLNKSFPAHYYIKHPEGISRKQVDEVVTNQYEYIREKLASSIWQLLNRRYSDDDLWGAINTAYAESVKQFSKNADKWVTMNGFFSYWLLVSWREFRNASIKERDLQLLMVREKHSDNEEDFGFTEMAAPQETESDLADFFEQEEFNTFVHERIYDYVDDCYLDGIFTMREINIFKIYCVNNYSIESMKKETQFSRTRIISALSKIKKHLATVDFKWWEFHPDLRHIRPRLKATNPLLPLHNETTTIPTEHADASIQLPESPE